MAGLITRQPLTTHELAGAAVLSTLVYPILGLRLRCDAPLEAATALEPPA